MSCRTSWTLLLVIHVLPYVIAIVSVKVIITLFTFLTIIYSSVSEFTLMSLSLDLNKYKYYPRCFLFRTCLCLSLCLRSHISLILSFPLLTHPAHYLFCFSSLSPFVPSPFIFLYLSFPFPIFLSLSQSLSLFKANC